MNKRDVTVDLAARLVASQFPQWAHLPIRTVKRNGWDNTTFRLGDELSLRLPNHAAYVPQIEKEHRWLPLLARDLLIPIPEPVALGRPSTVFPRPWSVYRWIAGDIASTDSIANLSSFAIELSAFLNALYSIDASDGPPAGEHNFFRGAPLTARDAELRDTIAQLKHQVNAAAALEVWEEALASTWDLAPVWVHGDVSPTNLLVKDGTLRAVIDFGCAAVGDPACDLMIAWTFFADESRRVFRENLHLDHALWSRSRGWALWKALITLAEEQSGRSRKERATRRMGWRFPAREVIDQVVAEHAGRRSLK